MSIRQYLDEEKAFNYHNIKTRQIKIGSITHTELDNIYHIRDQNNTHLLSFDSNRNLHTSVVKDYCDAIDAKHNINHATHSMSLATLSESFTTLSASVPTDENFSALQNKVTALETYVNNVRHFMTALSQSVNLIDPNTNNAFDFSNIVE
jgi:hypothetical protein